ncbi:hypothetical protein FCJ60_34535 [Burkholderia metallica]|nr:hypothetical protein [Burkholderia metallica]
MTGRKSGIARRVALYGVAGVVAAGAAWYGVDALKTRRPREGRVRPGAGGGSRAGAGGGARAPPASCIRTNR